ncbi:MAG TPA: bifunctional DedA family/phosphatase PAP2 family protein [Gemmatimonadaceae bacterium]|nr:bifunctional DedA family/phosphatase PAP2 family protein [Gemmatimonadaceae bacterium]
MHETLYDLVSSYGYLIVFLLVGIESLGIPLPGETALITASAFAALGRLNIFVVVSAAAAGAILGDNAGYWIGKRGGLALVRRYGRYFRLNEAKINKMHGFFERHGPKTIFLGRFISVLRCWAAALAGVANMPYGIFMFWNALGGVIWAAIFGTLGYFSGKNLPLLERYLGQASMAVALLVALVVGVALVARWFSAHRADVSENLSERWQGAAADPRLAEFRSHHQRLWKYVAARFARGEYLIIHLTIGLAISAGVMWLFSTITEDVVHNDPMTRFDVALASWLQRHDTAQMDRMFHYVSLIGSPLIIGILGLVIAAILIVKREWLVVSGWIAAFYGGSLLGRLLGALVHRPRTHEGSLLGSSDILALHTGHAFGSLLGFGLLAYLLVTFVVKRRSHQVAIVSAALALVVAISFSRLYLGVLYLSDAIGVYAAGVVWLAACVSGIELARRQHRPTLSEVGLSPA